MRKQNFLTLFILLLAAQISFAKPVLSETEKLQSLCKVWGFLKYYHPNVAKGDFDWDKQLFEKIRQLDTVQSKESLNRLYVDWINSLGNIKACKNCTISDKDYFDKNFDLNWTNDRAVFSDDLIAKLDFIEQNRFQGQQHYIKVEGSKNFLTNEKYYANTTDKEVRLQEFFRYWNLIEYFYPHKYLLQKKWDVTLSEFLPRFVNSSSKADYHVAFLELSVCLNDSHSVLWSEELNNYFGNRTIPFVCKYAEGKLVVVKYRDKTSANNAGIFVGDVISKINGKTISQLFQEKAKYISASNESKRIANAVRDDFFFKTSNNSVEVTLEKSGNESTRSVATQTYKEFVQLHQKEYDLPEDASMWRKISDSIGYVNLKTLRAENVDAMFTALKNTKAIVFDIRNYPEYTGWALTRRLHSESKPFCKYAVNDLNYPGKQIWKPTSFCGDKNPDAYQGKVIILVNEVSQSRAEYVAMQLRSHEHAVVIGSQTAGADGELLRLEFGGRPTGFTFNGVFNPDKTETQQIGIVPDIEVKPTITGIVSGKDEVLERAVLYARHGK